MLARGLLSSLGYSAAFILEMRWKRRRQEKKKSNEWPPFAEHGTDGLYFAVTQLLVFSPVCEDLHFDIEN